MHHGVYLSGCCLCVGLKDAVVKKERAEEVCSEQSQPETGHYLLQVDRQTKRSFKTPEAARLAAAEIKARFPALQVSIYDDVSRSRTLVGRS
jgi:hypothetical protein